MSNKEGIKAVISGMFFIIDKKRNVIESFDSSQKCRSAWWTYNRIKHNSYYAVEAMNFEDRKVFVNIFDNQESWELKDYFS